MLCTIIIAEASTVSNKPENRFSIIEMGIDRDSDSGTYLLHFTLVLFGLVLVWLYVDKQHTKFAVSLPLNAAQGSHSAAPMGRG